MRTVSRPVRLLDVGIQVLDCEHKTPSAARHGFPYIAIPDIQNGRINTTKSRRISDEDLKLWTRRTKPQRGDIIVTRRGRVGDTAPIPKDLECAIGQNLVLLRSTNENIDQDFLRWAVRSPQWWIEVERLTNVGAVFSSLNVRDIGQIRLFFPDPYTQRAIANVLGALDDKIVANTKLSRTIDQFLAAYYSRITKNSPTVPLGEIASVNPQTCKPLIGGSLRYIDISSVGQGSYEFPEISSWDDAPSRARRQVRSGDTLWSTVRPNRRSHALNLSSDELLVGSTGLAVLRPYGIGYSYLYESTKTPEFSAYLENVAEGSAYPAVRANRFEDAPINWPESAARDSFERTADPLRKMQHSNEVENQYLAALRDTLLPQLMSGKLRVKDAEALVESVV